MMKKITHLSILFLFCLSLNLHAQTEVSGGIFEPTTWSASNSPYLVTSDVVIFPEGSLTIEPGCEIRFAPETKLELRSGDLYALGTETDRITFTLDAETPDSSTKWKGIESTTPDTDFISVQLDYITVEYAEIGIFYTGGGNYREVNHANFNNNGIGIHCGFTGYEWVTIYNSTFTDNTNATEGRISMIDCSASGHELVCSGLYSFSNGTEGARLTNCIFTDNQAVISTASYILTSAYVDNCTFINNDIIAKAFRWEAKNSTFEGSSIYAIEAQTGTIDSCIFVGNTIGFQTFFAPYELTLTNNEFFENDYGIWVEGAGANISGNTICGNTIYDAYINTADPVNLANNCWCTANTEDIPALIFDAYDDVSSGIATYEPISVSCFGELFFPGDGNNNGRADAWDILPVGVHYNSLGEMRENQSTNWEGQEVTDWDETMITGLNLKHADANGDGVINEEDRLPILENYGNLHTNTAEITPVIDNENIYNLSLLPNGEVLPNMPASFDLVLDDATDFYGVAFAVESSIPFYQAGSFALNFENSVLGDEADLLIISKEFPNSGRVEVGIVRKDGQPLDMGGVIVTLDFIMIEDLLVSVVSNEGGGALAQAENFSLRVENIEAVTPIGVLLSVENTPTEVTITNTKNLSLVAQKVEVFPNPMKDVLFINTPDLELERIELFNQLGAKIATYQGVTSIGTKDLLNGIYFIKVTTKEGTTTKRVVK